MSLHGKTALVTGSTSGIGLGIATVLARQGARIILNGFVDPALPIETLIATLVTAGSPKVDYLAANLRHPQEITDMMAAAEHTLGGVDILVNNAGIQHVSDVEHFSPERWDDVIAINLSASFHTIRLALPVMKQRQWGRIINVASVHGLVASVQKSAYVTAKHGIIGLTKVVALEMAQTGITCNAICPGWVLTPLVQKQVEARAEREGCSIAQATIGLLSEKQPSQAFVTPEQLGELALFLCSDAASQVRGAAWNVDGGWAAQ